MKDYSNKQIGTYILLVALGFFASVAFWLYWQKLLTHPLGLFTSLESDLAAVAIVAASGVILLTAVSLMSLLLPKKLDLIAYGLIFAPLFILNQPTWVLALSLFILWLPAILFTWQIKREVENHIEFSAFHIFSARLPLMVTALSVVLGLQFFAASQAQAESFEFKIPENIFQQAVKIVQPMINEQVETQVQGVRDKTNQQLAQLPNLDQFPPEIQESLLRGEIPQELEEQLRQQGISDQQNTEFETQLKDASQGGQLDTENFQNQLTGSLLGELKTKLESQINQIIAPYRQYLPALLGFLVFFTIKTFGGIINLAAITVISVLISLLLQANLVTKKLEDVKAERLVVE